MKSFVKGDDGYTLIGLMAMVVISSIMMAAFAPTWGEIVLRDKEEELIFRGESYKFAIERYQKRFNKLPSRLDDLLKDRFIRKLYIDPITELDFELILQGPEGKKRESELTKAQRDGLRGDTPGRSSLGIIGVVSMSDELALRPYKEKERYNEWEFIAGEGQEGQQGQEGGEGEGEEQGGERSGDQR